MKRDPVWLAIRVLLAVWLVFALVALTGCAAAPTVTTIRVAVPTECRVAVPDRPAMPTEALSPDASLDAMVQAALAEIEKREGYEDKLRAALAACVAPINHGKASP